MVGAVAVDGAALGAVQHGRHNAAVPHPVGIAKAGLHIKGVGDGLMFPIAGDEIGGDLPVKIVGVGMGQMLPYRSEACFDLLISLLYRHEVCLALPSLFQKKTGVRDAAIWIYYNTLPAKRKERNEPFSGRTIVFICKRRYNETHKFAASNR